MNEAALILAEIRDVFAESSEIAAWAAGEGFSKPWIYLGVDEETPPGPDEYPVIAITGIRHTRGPAVTRPSWLIEIGAGVFNETFTTDEAKRTKTYAGFVQAEDLLFLMQKELMAARIGAFHFRGEASQINFHPLHISYTTATYETISRLRRRA